MHRKYVINICEKKLVLFPFKSTTSFIYKIIITANIHKIKSKMFSNIKLLLMLNEYFIILNGLLILF